MNKSELITASQQAIESVRDYLKEDGGDVEVVKVTDDGILWVELQGACVTCPQSYMTMKAGIERAVVKAVPGITGVKATNVDTESV